jgi:hypothetical protein
VWARNESDEAEFRISNLEFRIWKPEQMINHLKNADYFDPKFAIRHSKFPPIFKTALSSHSMAKMAPGRLASISPGVSLLYVLNPERPGSLSFPAVLLDDGERATVEMPYLWTTTHVYPLVPGPEFTGLVHAAGWVSGMRLSV